MHTAAAKGAQYLSQVGTKVGSKVSARVIIKFGQRSLTFNANALSSFEGSLVQTLGERPVLMFDIN